LAWAIDLRNAGLWQEALAFLEDMRLRRIDPDAYAYNNVAWQLEGVKVGAEKHVRIFRRSKVGRGEVMLTC